MSKRPVWSESSLSAWRKLPTECTAKSDQTGRMPRLSKSSLGAHSLCWFCHIVAHINYRKNIAVFAEKTDVPYLPKQSKVAISVMKLWPWKLGQGHQNLISLCPIYVYRLANLVTFHPMVCEITCRQTLFGLILVDWKSDQGHQNLFSFLSCPNVISMQIWLKSASWFMRYCAHKHLLA